MQGRLQPAACPYLTLIAETVRIAPSAAFEQKANCVFDLTLIRISFFDHRHRETVGAEDNLSPLWIRETRQCLVDLLHQRVQIYRIAIERLNAMHRYVVPEKAPPLVQAGTGRSRGVLRVEG